jgi:hypothetical protein
MQLVRTQLLLPKDATLDCSLSAYRGTRVCDCTLNAGDCGIPSVKDFVGCQLNFKDLASRIVEVSANYKTLLVPYLSRVDINDVAGLGRWGHIIFNF